MAENEPGLSSLGLRRLTGGVALENLNSVLLNNETQQIVADLDWDLHKRLLEAYGKRALLNEIALSRPLEEHHHAASPTAFMESLASTLLKDRPHKIKQHLQELVGKLIGLPSNELVDPDLGLVDIGINSIMAVELVSMITSSVGRECPATLIYQCPTINSLANFLVKYVFGDGDHERDETTQAGSLCASCLSDSFDNLSDEEIIEKLRGRVRRILE